MALAGAAGVISALIFILTVPRLLDMERQKRTMGDTNTVATAIQGYDGDNEYAPSDLAPSPPGPQEPEYVRHPPASEELAAREVARKSARLGGAGRSRGCT
jgi:hypothetical protein